MIRSEDNMLGKIIFCVIVLFPVFGIVHYCLVVSAPKRIIRRLEEEGKLRSKQIEAERKTQKYKAERQEEVKKENTAFAANNFTFFERLDNYCELTPLQKVFKADLYQVSTEIDIIKKKNYQPCEEDLKFE